MANFDLSWAVFTGVFSIFAVIPGFLLFIHSQLPSQKIRTMFEALKEADDFYLSCIEEGLVYGTKADLYRSELQQCHVRAEAARFEAHAARTYIDDVTNWIKGLSRTIRQICWKVRDVRADISNASLRERERQAALRNLATANTASEGGEPGQCWSRPYLSSSTA
ncbi:hypothetical protein L227DRAFT_198497 [Lentinus tigrinus ALCF2SS1-6]|uniref:Uncharacterized protein n=1 Tax=Lentinus tigrinus ALCF2SS1-6 TaxID=1328759 RepID=A0A5C2S2M4_9APHY|nr:hypothetical protein L227DRAFT_198497 [Lentinus tigrinus ALCF2SS1-6]